MKAFLVIMMVLIGSVAFAGDEGGEKAATETSPTDTTMAADTVMAKNHVLVYYFHGDRRCKTCLAIEEYSRTAIDSFKNELESGILKFEAVNRDKEENKHFNEDYKLYTSSLIVARFDDDKQVEWKSLDDIWKLTRDKDKFIQYVRTEIEKYLKAE